MSNAIVHAYRHKFYLRPILLHYLDETATLQFIIRVFDKLQVLLGNKCEVRIAKLHCQGKKNEYCNQNNIFFAGIFKPKFS